MAVAATPETAAAVAINNDAMTRTTKEVVAVAVIMKVAPSVATVITGMAGAAVP